MGITWNCHSDYNQGNHWFWFYDYAEDESWKKPIAIGKFH